MNPIEFEHAAENVYREMDDTIILGAWTVTYVPHCLVLRPVKGVSSAVVPPWCAGEEIMVVWDDAEMFELVAAVRCAPYHHTSHVRIVPYLEAGGVESVSDADWLWQPAQLDGEVTPSCTRLMEAIVKFLLDTSRLSQGHYLDVICPRNS